MYPQQGSAPPGWQTNNAAPPGTNYGYTQTSMAEDPYAAQYGQQVAPSPPPVAGGSGGYGQPGFGPPPTQPAPFGAPPSPAPFGPPSQPPTQKKSPALLIGVIALIVVLLAGLGTGGYFLLKGGSSPTTGGTTTPTAVPALYQASLTSDPGSWDCTTANTCAFSSDGYHIKAPQNSVYDSLLLKQTFDNLVIEVKGVIAQGDPQNAGLVVEFHVPQGNHAEGYGLFIFDDGTYSVVKWDSQGKPTPLIDTTSSSAIQGGLRQSNDVKIVINGTHYTFFANNQQIADTSDSTYANGYIGLGALGQGTESVFSNLTVTKP
jgi:hypothetical protein